MPTIVPASVISECAGAGDPEVGDLRLALVVDDHVLRLDVAVDDPAPVRVAERLQDLLGEVDRDVRRQRAALAHELLQRAPVDQLHRDVGRPVPLGAVEDADDVRVREPRRGLRLAPEALAELRVLGEAPAQQLQRHAAAEHLVLGAPDLGHAARARAA